MLLFSLHIEGTSSSSKQTWRNDASHVQGCMTSLDKVRKEMDADAKQFNNYSVSPPIYLGCLVVILYHQIVIRIILNHDSPVHFK